MGYLKGKSTLMVYDRHPELQSKWDKAFWARGYFFITSTTMSWQCQLFGVDVKVKRRVKRQTSQEQLP